MPRIVETVVYRLDELDAPAQDKARAWYREIGFDHDWYDAVYDDFQQIAAILGLRFRTTPVRLYGDATRQVPCIWFRGFWSQGDGAAFEALRKCLLLCIAYGQMMSQASATASVHELYAWITEWQFHYRSSKYIDPSLSNILINASESGIARVAPPCGSSKKNSALMSRMM